MPLYIRDPEVERLARKAMRMTKAKTLTDTVRRALENQIATEQSQMTRTAIMRAVASEFNQKMPKLSAAPGKEFYDEMWGDE